MGIENLKWRHWIVLGVIFGAALGYVRMQYPSQPSSYTIRHGLSLQRFVELAEGRVEQERRGGGLLDRLAQLARPAERHPGLRDVVIHPPLNDKNYVTGLYLQRVFSDGAHYVEFEMSAPVPFVVPGQRPPEDPNYTVREYLDEKAPQIGYRYLWWKHPTVSAAIWGIGAAVLIGGVWPVVVNLLIGAGFGRHRESEPEYDLERFSHEPEPSSEPAEPATEEELEKLRALEEELARNLAAGASAPTEANVTTAEASAAVKQLSTAPLGPLAVQQTEEEKEYQGEYYPVARPHKHPHEKH
jgi:hypothetical protein